MNLDLLKFTAMFMSAVVIPGLLHAAEVNLNVDNASPQVGDRITVTVNLSGFPLTYGGGLNLRYDSRVVRAISSNIDPGWGFVNQGGDINNASGSISDILFTDFSGKSGSVPVATIEMEVIGSGNANISASPSERYGFGGEGTYPMQVSINNSAASISVSGSDSSELQDTADSSDMAETAADTNASEESGQTSTAALSAGTAPGNLVNEDISADTSQRFTTGSGENTAATSVQQQFESTAPVAAADTAAVMADTTTGQVETGSSSDTIALNELQDSTTSGGRDLDTPVLQTNAGGAGSNVVTGNHVAATGGDIETPDAESQPESGQASGSRITYAAIGVVLVLVLLISFFRKKSVQT